MVRVILQVFYVGPRIALLLSVCDLLSIQDKVWFWEMFQKREKTLQMGCELRQLNSPARIALSLPSSETKTVCCVNAALGQFFSVRQELLRHCLLSCVMYSNHLYQFCKPIQFASIFSHHSHKSKSTRKRHLKVFRALQIASQKNRSRARIHTGCFF